MLFILDDLYYFIYLYMSIYEMKQFIKIMINQGAVQATVFDAWKRRETTKEIS